jgi:benzoylformate decarboxylase
MDLREQGSYYFGASGGLGFGLPAAVGAQLALPDRRVIAVIGDGSANYGITALWTAARYAVPVVVIILKNGTYGALRWFSEMLGTSETSSFDLHGIDFVRIAEGYGVRATAVSSADDFAVALKDALARTTPALIEVTTADLESA